MPFYSMYEKGSAAEYLSNTRESDILSSRSTRRAISISFIILGLLFCVTGLGMVFRSFYFKPDETDNQPTTIISNIRDVDENQGDDAVDNPVSLLPENENLQKESQGEEKRDLGAAINSSVANEAGLNENLLP